MAIDQPLTTWYCDVCSERIEDVQKGYLTWKINDSLHSHDFKIIHKTKCALVLDDHPASVPLRNFVGADGLSYLLSHLSLGPIMLARDIKSHCDASNIDEFVDLIRRLQTPYYEEARRKFRNLKVIENFSMATEIYPYLPDTLEWIVQEY
jgi:hypothetical protein